METYYRWWQIPPFRKFGWLAWTIAIVLLLVILISGCSTYEWYTATTTGDIESIVAGQLDRGATTDQIITFLDAKGWRPEGVVTADHDSLAVEAGVSPGTHMITSQYPSEHVRGCFPFSGTILVYFFLDDSGKLAFYRAFYVCTAL